MPIPVVARSKARTVFARSNTGIVGSNHTWVMDVCVRLFCVCAVLRAGSGLARSNPPSKAWTVFARSNAGIVVLKSTRGMDVSVRLFCVYVFLCVYVAVLRRADHSPKNSYRPYKKDYETKDEARAQ
jgi:hypothetical protein